jgi:hypothetical protein
MVSFAAFAERVAGVMFPLGQPDWQRSNLIHAWQTFTTMALDRPSNMARIRRTGSFGGDRPRPFIKIAQFCRETLTSLFGICGIDLDADGTMAKWRG